MCKLFNKLFPFCMWTPQTRLRSPAFLAVRSCDYVLTNGMWTEMMSKFSRSGPETLPLTILHSPPILLNGDDPEAKKGKTP